MKIDRMKTAVLLMALVTPLALMAQEGGEATFKTKCAGCHGADGGGKVGPALKGTKLAQDDIVLMLSKGKTGAKAPHTKPISGLTDDQIKTVAHYVKSLK